MARVVAFLRGINVGGRVVKKEALKVAFLSLGFENVVTYKQSGNVIFETTNAPSTKLKEKIETKLKTDLGYQVAVLLRTIDQLRSIIGQDPLKLVNQSGSSFLVTLIPAVQTTISWNLPLTIPKSSAQIISAKGDEVYSVTHGGGEGALPNPFVESMLRVKATTRNFNVIREIVEKYGQS